MFEMVFGSSENAPVLGEKTESKRKGWLKAAMNE